MRSWLRGFVAAAFAIAAAGPAHAAPENCPSCVLGVYDDAAMTRSSGTIGAFQTKSVYVGIQLGEGYTSFDELHFDAEYPAGFNVLEVTPYVTGGTIAPEGARGVGVTWPRCVTGSRLLFRVRVFTTRSVRDAVVRIEKASFTTCDSTARNVTLPGGCYVLNPSGRATPCTTRLQASTWGSIKTLFK